MPVKAKSRRLSGLGRDSNTPLPSEQRVSGLVSAVKASSIKRFLLTRLAQLVETAVLTMLNVFALALASGITAGVFLSSSWRHELPAFVPLAETVRTYGLGAAGSIGAAYLLWLGRAQVLAAAMGAGRWMGSMMLNALRIGRFGWWNIPGRATAVHRPEACLGEGLPPLHLVGEPGRQKGKANTEAVVSALAGALADFGVGARVTGVTAGPVVSVYKLVPGAGVPVRRLMALERDLAVALRVQSVRMGETPGGVKLEVPNARRELVNLRDILEEWRERSPESPLAIAIGRDTAGKAVTLPLDRMPHLLVAGATGMGKSVCIHSILVSLIMRRPPEKLRLFLVDPKQVELASYADLPHLYAPVAETVEEARAVLDWCVPEMERRYGVLKGMRVRSLYSLPEVDWPFANIVVVIDELADLLLSAGKNVEEPLVRLAQKARAAGMHLVVATQRPDATVLTGLIRANIPARIALKTATSVDSQIILNHPGAEGLLGLGDMLVSTPLDTELLRIQGAWIPEQAVEAVARWWVDNSAPQVKVDPVKEIPESGSEKDQGRGIEDGLLEDARRLALERGRISAAILQSRLGIGGGRASRILARMEELGWIGPANGNRPREIYLADLEAKAAQETLGLPAGEEK